MKSCEARVDYIKNNELVKTVPLLYTVWAGVEAPMYVDMYVDCGRGGEGIGRGLTVVGEFDFAKTSIMYLVILSH